LVTRRRWRTCGWVGGYTGSKGQKQNSNRVLNFSLFLFLRVLYSHKQSFKLCSYALQLYDTKSCSFCIVQATSNLRGKQIFCFFGFAICCLLVFWFRGFVLERDTSWVHFHKSWPLLRFLPSVGKCRGNTSVVTFSLSVFKATVFRLVTVHEHKSSCLYRASMTIKTLYYPTDAQIYNSYIQLELL